MAQQAESALKKLPFEGEYISAKNKKYREVVLLVPFFGARKPQMKRHVEFVNELGFDCVIYNLKKRPNSIGESYFSSQSLFGMKHIWADQIEKLLNEISGNKIVFAFSNPSASAIEAISRRNATDIKGLICDSGPSGELWKSILNYFTHEKPIHFLPLRLAATTYSTLTWNLQFLTAVSQDLEKIPSHFRILSIRGWKDKLISPNQIDKIFEPHPHLDWQKLGLPQAGHLNGLRDFRADYEPAVRQFLDSIATQI